MTQSVTVGDSHYTIETLAEPPFVPDPTTWRDEGSGRVEYGGDAITIDTLPKLVHTVWLAREFVGDLYVVFDALVLPPRGESNINFFLHARMADGGDVLDANLSGDYEEYHQRCTMYIVTFTGYDPDGRRDAEGNLVTVGWSRVRKDPGFRLLSERTDVRSEVGVPYRVEIVFREGRLMHVVNGTVMHDLHDPEPLPGGRLALRTFNTRLVCRDLRVAQIIATE